MVVVVIDDPANGPPDFLHNSEHGVSFLLGESCNRPKSEHSDVQLQIVNPDQLAELKATTDAADKLGLLATLVAAYLEQSYDLLVALRVAAGAEPEAAELEQKRQDQDHAALKAVAQHLHSIGALRPGLSAAAATDTLWVLSDVQPFTMLVRGRGWRLPKYRAWLADSLTAALLA